jgi:hypothetical protein
MTLMALRVRAFKAFMVSEGEGWGGEGGNYDERMVRKEEKTSAFFHYFLVAGGCVSEYTWWFFIFFGRFTGTFALLAIGTFFVVLETTTPPFVRGSS